MRVSGNLHKYNTRSQLSRLIHKKQYMHSQLMLYLDEKDGYCFDGPRLRVWLDKYYEEGEKKRYNRLVEYSGLTYFRYC